ncbi:MAG: hypothetical protein ACREC4_00830 [Methylocella sp.]
MSTGNGADCMNFHAFNGYAGGQRGSKRTHESLLAKGLLVQIECKSRDQLGSSNG